MKKTEAIDILKAAQWSYLRRISPQMPYPAAMTSYPGLNFDILKAAGIDVSGKNGEGVALLKEDEDGNPRYAVFGKKNMLYMNEQGIDFGQENRIVRLGFTTPDDDGSMLVG